MARNAGAVSDCDSGGYITLNFLSLCTVYARTVHNRYSNNCGTRHCTTEKQVFEITLSASNKKKIKMNY